MATFDRWSSGEPVRNWRHLQNRVAHVQKQIRSLTSEEISLELIAVEVDETYAGGKRKGKRGRPGVGDRTKVPVVGLAQRETKQTMGRVIARVTRDVKMDTLQGLVRKYVLPKSTVYTDDFIGYSRSSVDRRAGIAQSHRTRTSSAVRTILPAIAT